MGWSMKISEEFKEAAMAIGGMSLVAGIVVGSVFAVPLLARNHPNIAPLLPPIACLVVGMGSSFCASRLP